MALETCFNWELLGVEKEKVAKSKPGTPPAPSTPGTKTLGHGQTLKIHIKKATQGPGWRHVKPKDKGLDVGQKHEPPQRSESSQPEPRWRRSDEDTAFLCKEQMEAAGRSPLTNELLTLGENVTDVLDYNDNLEITAAVVNIPPW